MTDPRLRLLQKIEEDLGIDLSAVRQKTGPCQSRGCPATVAYDEILHENEDGWLFDFNNLLVWLYNDEVQLDRDEHTVELKKCDARERGLLE